MHGRLQHGHDALRERLSSGSLVRAHALLREQCLSELGLVRVLAHRAVAVPELRDQLQLQQLLGCERAGVVHNRMRQHAGLGGDAMALLCELGSLRVHGQWRGVSHGRDPGRELHRLSNAGLASQHHELSERPALGVHLWWLRAP